MRAIPGATHCRWGDELYGGSNVLRLLETTQEGIRRYDAEPTLLTLFASMIPGVCALAIHSVALALRGLPDQARRALQKALDLADFPSHPPTIGLAHRVAGKSHK
jgi:hypothetical protein